MFFFDSVECTPFILLNLLVWLFRVYSFRSLEFTPLNTQSLFLWFYSVYSFVYLEFTPLNPQSLLLCLFIWCLLLCFFRVYSSDTLEYTSLIIYSLFLEIGICLKRKIREWGGMRTRIAQVVEHRAKHQEVQRSKPCSSSNVSFKIPK